MNINTSKKINIFLSLIILAIVPTGEIFSYMSLPDHVIGFPLHFLFNQRCPDSCFIGTNLIIDLLIAFGLAIGLIVLYKYTGKRFIVAESLHRGIVAGYLSLIILAGLAGPSYAVQYIIFFVFLLTVFIISKNTLSRKMKSSIDSLQGEIKVWLDSRLSLYFMILYLFVQVFTIYDMYKTTSMWMASF